VEVLAHLIPLLVATSLFLIDLALGLAATRDDILFMGRHPILLLRAFVAINVVVPLAAMAAVYVLPLHPIAKAGVILMAVSPLPTMAPGKEIKVGGRRSYAYGLYVSMVLLSVVVTPATVAILGAVYHKAIQIPAARIAETLGGSVLLPLVLGFALQRLFPKLASAAAPWIARLSTVVLVVVAIPAVARLWPLMWRMTGDGVVAAIAAIIVVALLGGYLLAGSDRRDRVALGVAAASRHPGVALMIASANGLDKSVGAILIHFVLVGAVITTIYQAWVKRGGRAKGGPAAVSS
jgi:BASS family bile acid:Na+ symporter